MFGSITFCFCLFEFIAELKYVTQEKKKIFLYLHACSLTHCVRLFATLWTVAHQASLSMGFLRQEYWSELPFPSSGDVPDPGVEPASPALTGRFFTAEPVSQYMTTNNGFLQA